MSTTSTSANPSTHSAATDNTSNIVDISPAERKGRIYCAVLQKYISNHDGKYIRDESGNIHVILGDQRISLAADRNNYKLNELVLNACDISTISQDAQVALQRLGTVAHRNASAMQFRRFSALSQDHQRLYVPSANSDLLCISESDICIAANGSNLDSFWVEHPKQDALINQKPDVGALKAFETLLVETQACTNPAMRWFVAMNEGLMPFVRETCPARFIAVHLGASQCGKSSGAQRFTLFHGLGEVKGDFTVAAFGNLPDPGLLVIDNKEQSNFSRELIDYCLFLATGAERARSNQDGTLRVSGTRPIGVITSIEGVVRVELQKRCVNVDYGVPGPKLKRGPIEGDIGRFRHEIGCALMLVLQRYLAIRFERRETPNPIPEFEEHFTELCYLLCAYADIASKPRAWADRIMDEWNAAISGAETDENDLENPIWQVITAKSDATRTIENVNHEGHSGTLYVTEGAQLLNALIQLKRDQHRESLQLPVNAQGLTRRLGSGLFQKFNYLPTDTPGIVVLKRTSTCRPIGFFLRNDDMTARRQGETYTDMAA